MATLTKQPAQQADHQPLRIADDPAVITARERLATAQAGLSAAIAAAPPDEADQDIARRLLDGEQIADNVQERKASDKRIGEWRAAVQLGEQQALEAERAAERRIRQELMTQQRALVERIAAAFLPLQEAIVSLHRFCASVDQSGVGLHYNPPGRIDFRDCDRKAGTFADVARWAQDACEVGLLSRETARRLGANLP